MIVLTDQTALLASSAKYHRKIRDISVILENLEFTILVYYG